MPGGISTFRTDRTVTAFAGGLWNAWTEVWNCQFWHGLDPTHNRLADERYIKLSHGRDFMDAAVDRGCFLGKAGQEQTILIKVEEK
mgnify:CR=1 FL=1